MRHYVPERFSLPAADGFGFINDLHPVKEGNLEICHDAACRMALENIIWQYAYSNQLVLEGSKNLRGIIYAP